MIRDRHQMPDFITSYIFDGEIKRWDMFNYEKTDLIVEQFLNDNIEMKEVEKNGTTITCGARDLVVYVTGLSSCLASIIKMTAMYRVNLTLMHFNISNEIYMPQVIWDSFGKSEIDHLVKDFASISLVNCEFEEVKEKTIYTIKIIEFSGRERNDADLYIFKNEPDMWETYSTLIKTVMLDKQKRKALYAEEAEIKDGKIQFRKRIGQSCNFDSIYKTRNS